MSERWQRELGKLRVEEMPDTVRERAERGPQRELPHDGRQRVVAGVVAFAVFIGAGAFAWRAFDRKGAAEPAVDQPRPVVVELSADPFAATLMYEGITQQGFKRESSWQTPDGTNATTSANTIRFESFVRVPAGTPVEIRSDAAELSASLEHMGHPPGPVRTVALEAGTGILHASSGRYRLQVTGTWDRGGATFAFGVELTSGEADVVLTLQASDRAPLALLAAGGQTQQGIRESYEWCDDAGECVGGIADFFEYPPVTRFLAVDAGAALHVIGDSERFDVEVTDERGDPVDAPAVADGSAMPQTPGRYVWNVSATWTQGNANFYLGIEVVGSADAIPDVLHLTCTSESTSVDTGVVRTQPDGVHIEVEAGEGVRGVDIVNDPDAAELFGVGFPLNGRPSHQVPIEPGSWHAGCYGGGRHGVDASDVGTERAAAFTVVDPDGFFAPVDLACDDPTARLFPVTGTPSGGVPRSYQPSPVTIEESAAAVPGILPSDVVREAGYADGPGFKSGPLYSVLRDGRTVARLHVPVEVGNMWGVSVDACPGSGIGPDAPPGAAGPTPDTAVVRCLESRTEVATPIVNTQVDGLHIEVQNPWGSQALVVVGGWERDRVFTIPIADQAASIVVPVRPGGVQISCRSNAETANADPFGDRHSDGLQLQDRSGHFLPYAPGCDSSEEVPLEPPRDFVEPAGESFVRGNLSGVLSSDTVERAGYLAGRTDDGPWRIVRDGEVVAQVEFPSLEGIVCRGAGITGRR
jgi:hypothetical protein